MHKLFTFFITFRRDTRNVYKVLFLNFIYQEEIRSFAAAAVVDAALQMLSSGHDQMEDNIVSQLKSLLIASDEDPEKEEKEKLLTELSRMLLEMGVDVNKLSLVTQHSIGCYFICTSEAELRQLRGYFECDLMKIVLQKIFTLLLKDCRKVFIIRLTWDIGEYNDCLRRLAELMATGWLISFDCHVLS